MRTNLLQSKRIHVIYKNNAMRISHGNTGQRIVLAANLRRERNNTLSRQPHRNTGRFENRLAHIHFNGTNKAVLYLQTERLDTAECINPQRFLFGNAAFIDIAADTADSVPAHHGAGTIRVVQIHHGVSVFCGADQDQSIGTDSEMTVAQPSGQRGRIRGNRFFKTIDINIIIADAMHLCELQGSLFPFP